MFKIDRFFSFNVQFSMIKPEIQYYKDRSLLQKAITDVIKQYHLSTTDKARNAITFWRIVSHKVANGF